MATGSGFWDRLATVDHKIVGRRYIVTAFVFFVLAGILVSLVGILGVINQAYMKNAIWKR